MKSHLTRDAITALIRHAGDMCLIDEIDSWASDWIRCRASLWQAIHPLQCEGVVPSTVAIEYAAQAGAIHGALLDGGTLPKVGYLAKLKDIEFFTNCIDHHDGHLDISAHLLAHNQDACMYTFEVKASFSQIASGTLMIFFSEQEQ